MSAMHQRCGASGGRLARRANLGLSIVELMVGIAIGLFVLAGATMLLTTQLGDNRRLLLEAQVQQDMRAAADLIAHDLRRANYWGHAYRQIWPVAGAASTANPYSDIQPPAAPAGTSTLEYHRSTDEEQRPIGTDDGQVTAAEAVGFMLNAARGTIDIKLGDGNWQALTDTNVLRVTRFDVTLVTQVMPVPCGVQCPALGPNGCPLFVNVRDASIVMVAEAVHDAAVQRTLRDNVRLRNDITNEQCPVPAGGP